MKKPININRYGKRRVLRAWSWDGAHPRELPIEGFDGAIPAGADSRGIYLEGEPDVTLTVNREPGGQCLGCPRCGNEREVE